MYSTPEELNLLAERLLAADFLKDREKEFLKMRLGLQGCSPCTLKNIGDRYGITRERVRQIGEAIIKKTRENLPEYKKLTDRLFSKSWESEYSKRRKRLKFRRAAIKRKRTIVSRKCDIIARCLDEFSGDKEQKQAITMMFRELRAKQRKNASLFQPEVAIRFKALGGKWRMLKGQSHRGSVNI